MDRRTSSPRLTASGQERRRRDGRPLLGVSLARAWAWAEALAGGPIGKLVDGDVVRSSSTAGRGGRVNLVGLADRDLEPAEAGRLLADRGPHPRLRPHPELPADTRLWAALQHASGGTWAGCVYDVDRISR
jgi:dihydroxyacid dehydratase/phosphogluconate dehydratase